MAIYHSILRFQFLNKKIRQNLLFGVAARGKGLSLLEGLGKEYITWRETSVGKPGTQAKGRHVVIRASQGQG
jgi:hypothetical protein